MKLIFSKKGFDTNFGGQPSPIFPDGSMVSLPIPDKYSQCPYASIAVPISAYNNMLDLLLALGCRQVKPSKSKTAMSEKICAHLDPDLIYGSRPRQSNWRPAFGQSNAAMGHLRNQEVGQGDIFLFYGIFCEVKFNNNDKLEYTGKVKQIIWGWMQIGEVKFVPDIINNPAYGWLGDHPHLMPPHNDDKNYIFIASQYLNLPGIMPDLPGAGVFTHLAPELVLSHPDGKSFTHWRLPAFFYPFPDKTPLTYHANQDQWQLQGENVLVTRRGGYGQEFVLNCNEYMPEAMSWLKNLLAK